MNHTASPPVILVGFGHSSITESLARLLSASGFPVEDCPADESVSRLLEEQPQATVIVYDHDAHTAETVLDRAAALHHRTPVVVVVDHADFSHYYSLMNRGVVGYFEAEESLSLILESIAQAAKWTGTV